MTISLLRHNNVHSVQNALNSTRNIIYVDVSISDNTTYMLLTLLCYEKPPTRYLRKVKEMGKFCVRHFQWSW